MFHNLKQKKLRLFNAKMIKIKKLKQKISALNSKLINLSIIKNKNKIFQ